MPSLQKRSNGIYYFIVVVDGVQKWISLRTKNKSIARERYADLSDRYERGIIDLSRKKAIPSIQQLLNEYLPYCQQHKSSRTYRDAEGHIRLFLSPYFGNIKVSDLTAKHIEEFQGILLNAQDESVKASPYHPRTINHILETLRKILRRAVDNKDIREMPCKIKMLKTPDALPRYATMDHVKDWMKYLDPGPRLRAILSLMTGISDRDLGLVRRDGYDHDNAVIRYRRSKTSSDIVIPLTPNAMQIMDYLVKQGNSPYLFTARSSKKAFAIASKKLQEKGGKNLTSHMLRHSFATWLFSIGVEAQYIQQMLGHKDLKTTLRYARVMPEHLRAAISKIDQNIDVKALLSLPKQSDGRLVGKRWTEERKKAQAERMKGNRIGSRPGISKSLAGENK